MTTHGQSRRPLFREGLSEGMEFRVEVIDTWAMTLTPLDGVFTVKRRDRYVFVDRDGRAVALPGKPGVALRIRYAGGAAPGVSVPAAGGP
jgi:hypothetical protein